MDAAIEVQPDSGSSVEGGGADLARDASPIDGSADLDRDAAPEVGQDFPDAAEDSPEDMTIDSSIAAVDFGQGQNIDSAIPIDGGAPVVTTCGKNLADEPVGVNRRVLAISVGGDGTAYLGGTFTYAGPVTGGAVPFDLPSGEPTSGFPKVAGDVYAILADGTGGWFLGGDFTQVGTLSRKNLAHIGSDGTVDSGWIVDTDDVVRALALGTDTLYVGGDFTTLGGKARLRLGSVDIHGTVSSWNPGVALPDPQGHDDSSIAALLLNQGTLYVGGSFTEIAGQPRTNLASFNVDGSLTAWDPQASQMGAVSVNYPDGGGTIAPVETGSIKALFVSGTNLYVGGSFETVSGVPHRALALFDAAGKVTSWDPQFGTSAIVEAFAMNAGVLYVGGYFAGTSQGLRNQLAAFDSAGNLTDWNPNLSPRRGLTDNPQQIYALMVVGDTIYVAGEFAQGGAQARANLAAVDSGGNVLAWNPFADGPVYTLARDGNTLYAGGKIRTMCGQTRNYLAAINAAGKLTDWNPNANRYVDAIVAGSDVVYVGGTFSKVGGQARSNLAAVATGGTVTSWNPSVYTYGWVNTMVLSGSTLYVGGNFSSVAGQTRKNLAAVDASGALLPWAPEINWVPESMAMVGDVLYVGGDSLNAIAADGSLLPWNPSPNDYVYALATSGTTLYVGGYFTTIAGETRNDLAAFDGGGNLLPWNPNAGPTGNGVLGLAVLADKVYAIGEFASISGQPRNGLAAIGTDGILAPWDPAPDHAPQTVATSDTTVFVGGWFTSIASKAIGGVAILSP